MAAKVEAVPWAQRAVSIGFRQQLGRDLVRSGDSMFVIDVRAGDVALLPVSSWHWEDPHDPHPGAWSVRATYYGPSSSVTRNLPADGVVFIRWGGSPGTPYVVTGPMSWAYTTAWLQSEVERSLADEASGPITNLIPVPDDVSDKETEDDDPFRDVKNDIRAARGAGGLGRDHGERLGRRHGRGAASRLARRAAGTETARVHDHVAGAGVQPGARGHGHSGGAVRRCERRHHPQGGVPLLRQNPVQRMADLAAAELSAKLETPVRFNLTELHAWDMQTRAVSFQRMVQSGMDLERAVVLSGLMAAEGAE